ncbi:MAG: hypothetical protein HYZ18_14975 [Pseudogulbenkiania sp.]|nr:hypothetical protein [Pseudogulbenkiania sp.]
MAAKLGRLLMAECAPDVGEQLENALPSGMLGTFEYSLTLLSRELEPILNNMELVARRLKRRLGKESN